MKAVFHRIQFTPDLLPADLTGTEIYRPQEGTFSFQQGPLFHNLVLADEVNRAPAKVQSALLEAMAERQITVGKQTYALSELFLVMATQNPIEQEGTYPLPEAQLDRFLLHVRIDYPDASAEKAILDLSRKEALPTPSTEIPSSTTLIQQADIFAARQEVLQLHMAENVEKYLLEFILATRKPKTYGDDLQQWLEYGASPRADDCPRSLCACTCLLQGRDFVSPEDVQLMAFDTLRHRLIVNYEAEADGVDSDRIIHTLIERIAVP